MAMITKGVWPPTLIRVAGICTLAETHTGSHQGRITQRRLVMAESVYRVTEVIGVSGESWEAAARNAVETAGKTVRDLRVAEVLRQDVTIENGSLTNYRVRLAISFKYESGQRAKAGRPDRSLAAWAFPY